MVPADTHNEDERPDAAVRGLTIRYDPAEDRLIIQLGRRAGGQQESLALALTRRVWRGFRFNLQTMLDRSSDLPPAMDPGVRHVLSAAHHQAQAARVPVRVQKAAPLPSGFRADLIVGVRCGQRRSDRRWLITFKVEGKPDVPLVLNDLGLHAMANALFRRETATGWDLPRLPIANVAGADLSKPPALH